jgi:HEAT repeat protein
MGLFGPPDVPKLKAAGDVKALAKALANERDYRVRGAAAEALGSIGDPLAVESLVAAVKDPAESVRQDVAAALGEIGDERCIEGLTALLSDKDAVTCGAAVEALRKIGLPAVRGLVVALDSEAAVSKVAVEALKELGLPALGAMVEALRDTVGTAGPAITWVLGSFGAPAVEPLLAALEDENGNVRMTAAGSLGRISDVRAVEPLIAALGDADVTVGAEAATALGSIGDARAVEPLIGVLDAVYYLIPMNAAWSLGQIGDARAVEPLLAKFVRATGGRYVYVDALGMLGDQRAVEPLSAALLDQDKNVRESAAEALQKLGHVPVAPRLKRSPDDSAQAEETRHQPETDMRTAEPPRQGRVGADDGSSQATLQSTEGRDPGVHDRAHAMLARLEVLIATSSQVAIPGYLQDKSTSDIEEAVGICDNLLRDGVDPTSMSDMVVGQAREAFLQEIRRR